MALIGHGSEFVHVKWGAVEAGAFLPEQYRSAHVLFDKEVKQEENWADENKTDGRGHKIKSSLKHKIVLKRV